MIVTGVTGGIGSGKSTLCGVWQELGAKIVYADDLAKKLMVTDEEVKTSLTKLFGDRTYNDDGSLNKPHLIREAFEKNRVEELNGVVHPAVARKFKEMIDTAAGAGVEMLVKEAALLLHNGRPDDLDLVVLVLAPERDQLERVKVRDGVDEKSILDRMNKQPDFEKLKQYADYIIRNDGTLEEFKHKSKELFFKVKDHHRNHE